VFQGSLQPAATSASQRGSEIQGRNGTERCPIPALMRYFCKSRGDNPAASAGCKLCPQGWQLHGGRCYWLSKEKGNWTEGEKGCEKLESQLVVLQDKKEKVNPEEKKKKKGQENPLHVHASARLEELAPPLPSSCLSRRLDKRKKVDKVCSTLKNNVQEEDTCDGEHQWVCQKEPFQLSP
ncbi:KLRG1 protein, partial [Pluvianellus socialis]|nr:KLRG1 protein [Pluvianellus socialis]